MLSFKDKALLDRSQQSVLHALAFQFLWNAQPEKALPLYELLLELNPEEDAIRTGLAYAQIQCGMPQAALATVSQWKERRDPVVQLLLGKALILLDDADGAKAAMQRFCNCRPEWPMPVLVDADRVARNKDMPT